MKKWFSVAQIKPYKGFQRHHTDELKESECHLVGRDGLAGKACNCTVSGIHAVEENWLCLSVSLSLSLSFLPHTHPPSNATRNFKRKGTTHRALHFLCMSPCSKEEGRGFPLSSLLPSLHHAAVLTSCLWYNDPFIEVIINISWQLVHRKKIKEPQPQGVSKPAAVKSSTFTTAFPSGHNKVFPLTQILFQW